MKVALYGIGEMGASAARLLVQRGIPIVAAIARSPQKVGKDLSEVVGLDEPTGVIVSDDAAGEFARTEPDIVILTTNSYLADHEPFLETVILAGANAITIAEEASHPWRTSPDATRRIDALAREHGVTVYGGGHEDAFWIGLGAQIIGAAHRVDAIRWESRWNPDTCGPEILSSLGVGERPDGDPAPVDWQPNMPRPPFALPALDGLADRLGLPEGPRTVTTEYVLAETPTWSWALDRDIAVGEIVGLRDRVRRDPQAEGEPLLEFTVSGILKPGVHDSGESWEIEGVPNLRMETEFSSGAHQVTGQVVNRLQDVIDAAPGWVKHAEMPAIAYRG
ncbi:hypothetical protein ACFPZL_06295 [Leucobacter soli]|uniref:2,4-diaminopentanoate dehydrogenase n=1 Tax=Leucobacter soli TaxID=2812850 RepID=A0A916JWA4_9MICO|nr:hypothetical protein [Leucobacter soli]CAG7610322.1 2,4-diaminopentanoate dehydrogenase [Leucobacter soli]